MGPLLRIWAMSALAIALLLALRGAWLAAAALFVLSPAPVWAFAQHDPDSGRLSASWMTAVVGVLIAVVALYAVVVATGGLPPVHEWRAAAR